MAEKVLWPSGPGTASAALTATGAQAVTVTDMFFVINGVTTEATGNRTINLTIDSELKPGAQLLVKSKTNGTETTIFGTGMQGATITGVAGKTKVVSFIYDGTNFVEAGTPVQID
jgi:hypothetical protein